MLGRHSRGGSAYLSDMRRVSHRSRRFTIATISSLAASTAMAQTGGVPDYDFDWATIGNVNNPAYTGPTSIGTSFPLGRGSVGYTYRMSKLEVTTAQWIEFLNTYTTQSFELSQRVRPPLIWGGLSDLSYTGPGIRYKLGPDPNAARLPAAGLTWYTAAMYCNFLHHGKNPNPASLDSGAYDTSTWGRIGPDGRLSDAEGHLPGARFWIPTFDEWVKAAHFDPAGNDGTGRWWQGPNRSDALPIYGPPGIGQSSAGTENWSIPLGAYPSVQSAYGLLDVSGGAREWLGTFGPQLDETTRRWDGASVRDVYLGDDARDSSDLAWRGGAEAPSNFMTMGLRIASVPAPPACAFFLTIALTTRRRGR